MVMYLADTAHSLYTVGVIYLFVTSLVSISVPKNLEKRHRYQLHRDAHFERSNNSVIKKNRLDSVPLSCKSLNYDIRGDRVITLQKFCDHSQTISFWSCAF